MKTIESAVLARLGSADSPALKRLLKRLPALLDPDAAVPGFDKG